MEKEEEDGQEDVFFLCFTLMETSGSSPCNIAHWTKALFSILILIHLTLSCASLEVLNYQYLLVIQLVSLVKW